MNYKKELQKILVDAQTKIGNFGCFEILTKKIKDVIEEIKYLKEIGDPKYLNKIADLVLTAQLLALNEEVGNNIFEKQAKDIKLTNEEK